MRGAVVGDAVSGGAGSGSVTVVHYHTRKWRGVPRALTELAAMPIMQLRVSDRGLAGFDDRAARALAGPGASAEFRVRF